MSLNEWWLPALWAPNNGMELKALRVAADAQC